MSKYRVVFAAILTSVIGWSFAYSPRVQAAQDTLPARLTDQEFWRLSQESSEPNGYFQSDNLLSNELGFQYVIPQLVQTARQGGVYLGVGPEQNFTYISALHPKMVIITDIRRGNLHTQLMYKALFELSADRADFISKLFTKKRPEGLTTKSTAAELFNAYWPVDTGAESVYKENLKAIDDLLTKKHGLALSDEDLKGIEYVYYNFYWFGPLINYNSSSASGAGRGGMSVSYADLMMASDGNVYRSFLATEENFKVLKDLEEKNMVVPVVGNFGGPKALRAVGKYLKDHNAVVSAFYLSNVEQYLSRDGIWINFCQNVATLPLDEKSTFIYSAQGGGGGRGGSLASALRSMQADAKTCGG